MSFIVFNDNRRPKAIKSIEKSHHLWHVLIGEEEAENEKESEMVLAIKRIYLNPANAPQSYLTMYPQLPSSYASTLGLRT